MNKRLDRRLYAVDWTLAEGRLIRLITLYLRFADEQKTLSALNVLRKRYNEGERTKELFDAMIQL